jgi:hypothetical protein
MDAKEFLESLQIVELTRSQPELKAVHDYMIKKCVEHAKEIAKQLEEARKADEEKAKAQAKAVESPPKPVESPPRYSRERTNG